MYWDWLQYFAAKPDRKEYGSGQPYVWRVFYQFWCQSGAAGNLNDLKTKFMAHKKHLDAVLPDLMRSPLLPAGEKMRLSCLAPTPPCCTTQLPPGDAGRKKRKGN